MYSIMISNHPSRTRGFTLVELMLALAISIFLIGGVVLIQSSSRSATIEAERLSRLQENIRFTSDLLVRDIRNAGFRDQLSLTFPQFATIGTPFAQIITDAGGNEILEIRYAGWGSCADGFEVVTSTDIPQVISNRYWVQLQDDGRFALVCRDSADGGARVSLALDVQSVDYTLMCVAGAAPPYTFNNTCTTCNLWVNGNDFEAEQRSLEQTCYGVRIGLEFEPEGSTAPPVFVELSASFRNVLLGQVMWKGVPEP